MNSNVKRVQSDGDDDDDSNYIPLIENLRPTQPLNKRKVTYYPYI